LSEAGVRPGLITTVGWVGGLACIISVVTHHWIFALVLWLFNRICDALDGAVARWRGPTDLGGYLDIVADFSIYGGFLVGVGLAEPSTRIACLVLFLLYYLSGTTFLTLSSLIEKRRRLRHDERSIEFVGGLAEGFETVVVYAAITIFHAESSWLIWGFAVAVGVTVVQRIVFAHKILHVPPHERRSETRRISSPPVPTTPSRRIALRRPQRSPMSHQPHGASTIQGGDSLR
jgi:phosphatidylglycerophosphate synthase